MFITVMYHRHSGLVIVWLTSLNPLCECVREREEKRTSIEEEGRSGGNDCVGGGNWILNCVFSLYDLLRYITARKDFLTGVNGDTFRIPLSFTHWWIVIIMHHHRHRSAQNQHFHKIREHVSICSGLFYRGHSFPLSPVRHKQMCKQHKGFQDWHITVADHISQGHFGIASTSHGTYKT